MRYGQRGRHLVKNEEMSHTDKEERNILHTVKRRKSKWFGHILRKNCLLKLVVEGKIEEKKKKKKKKKKR